MSDGHFNRAILPHTDFQSGVKVGMARTRTRALQTLDDILASVFPDATDDQQEQARLLLRQALQTP